MRKHVTLACFFLFFVVSTTAATQTDPSAALRQQKIRNAAMRSIEESLSYLKTQTSSANKLAAIILDNKRMHERRTDSERLTREYEQENLKRIVRSQLEVFARDQRELPGNWADNVMTAERTKIDSMIQSLLSSEFGKRFNDARKIAVDSQTTTLSRVLNPSPAEIESLAGSDLANRVQDSLPELVNQRGAPLLRKYVDLATKGQEVLEENRANLEKDASSAIIRGLEDLWRQMKYVEQHDGAGTIEASEIQRAMLEGLKRLAGSNGVFPSVREAASRRSQELEGELFRNYIDEHIMQKEGRCQIADEKLKQNLPLDYRRLPSTLSAHLDALINTLRPEIQSALRNTYVNRLRDPSQRQQLSRKLAAQFSVTRFDERLSRCIQSTVRSHREHLAEREIADVLPSIANFSFELDDDDVSMLLQGRSQGLRMGRPPSRPIVLQETEQLVKDSRQALADEGKRVIDRQIALADDQERKSRYRNRIQLDDEKTPQEVWQNRYASEVLADWHRESNRSLFQQNGRVLHPDKYGHLLGPTLRRISEVITFEFHQRKPTEVPKTNVSAAGGGGSGSGGGVGNGVGSGSGPGGGGGFGVPCAASPVVPASDRPIVVMEPQSSGNNYYLVILVFGAFVSGIQIGRVLVRPKQATP